MGLLDLPSPAYGLIDGAVATVMPPLARLVLWAVFGGVISMALYRLLSPQHRVAAAKRRAAAARRRLNEHTGDFASAMPLVREQLGAAVRQCALVLPATLIASLPVLTLLIWLDKTYAYAFPSEGVQPRIEITPARFDGRWRVAADGPWIHVREPAGGAVGDLPVRATVPLIEKWHWWNLLSGNPAGYLPDSWPLERIRIELAERSYLNFGPEWIRSWIVIFLPALILVSLAMHRLFRIE